MVEWQRVCKPSEFGIHHAFHQSYLVKLTYLHNFLVFLYVWVHDTTQVVFNNGTVNENSCERKSKMLTSKEQERVTNGNTTPRNMTREPEMKRSPGAVLMAQHRKPQMRQTMRFYLNPLHPSHQCRPTHPGVVMVTLTRRMSLSCG